MNRSTFRAGLVQADKLVIYPILEWLLKRVPELQKRAYLARFLVKIDVPPEIMAEDQIPELFAQVKISRIWKKYCFDTCR